MFQLTYRFFILLFYFIFPPPSSLAYQPPALRSLLLTPLPSSSCVSECSCVFGQTEMLDPVSTILGHDFPLPESLLFKAYSASFTFTPTWLFSIFRKCIFWKIHVLMSRLIIITMDFYLNIPDFDPTFISAKCYFNSD